MRVRKVRVTFNDPRGPPRTCGYVFVPLASENVTNAPFSRTIAGEPADHGIDAAGLDDLVARAQREIDEGRLPSC